MCFSICRCSQFLSPQVAFGDRLHGLPLTHVHIALSIPRTRLFSEADMARNEGGAIADTEDGQELAVYPLEPRVPDLEDDHPTMQEIESLASVIATRMPTLVRIGFDVDHSGMISKFWDVCRISSDEGYDHQVSLKEVDWFKAREEMRRTTNAGSEI